MLKCGRVQQHIPLERMQVQQPKVVIIDDNGFRRERGVVEARYSAKWMPSRLVDVRNANENVFNALALRVGDLGAQKVQCQQAEKYSDQA